MALLERYAAWLKGGGASEQVTRTIYLPMAGHILGLALKPHWLLDLEQDLAPAEVREVVGEAHFLTPPLGRSSGMRSWLRQ